jgi:hypothetical protein
MKVNVDNLSNVTCRLFHSVLSDSDYVVALFYRSTESAVVTTCTD